MSAVDGLDAVSQRPAAAIGKIESVSMTGHADAGDLARRGARQVDRLADRVGGRSPKPGHILFDMAGGRADGGDASTGDDDRAASLVEQSGFDRARSAVQSHQQHQRPPGIAIAMSRLRRRNGGSAEDGANPS